METTNKGFMAKFQELLEKYVVPVATKISQQKHLASVRDGLTVLVPVTIIGGFAILLAQPPINATMQPTQCNQQTSFSHFYVCGVIGQQQMLAHY